MRLPASYIQINTAQQDKLAELLSFVRKHDIVVPDDQHWYWTTFEIVARTLLHRRYSHLALFWHRCVERQTQHPIDFLYDFKKDCEKRKVNVILTTPTQDDLKILTYDETKCQTILEVFDYCQSISPIYNTEDMLAFDANGQIANTPFHWYQLMINYIVPVLVYDKAYVCQAHTDLSNNPHFGWVGRMIFGLRTKDPIEFIKSLQDKRINNVSFYEDKDSYLKVISQQEKTKKEKTKT